MKKSFLLFLLMVVFLSGCSWNWFKKKEQPQQAKPVVEKKAVIAISMLEIGKEYGEIFDVKKINNKLTFKIKHNNNWFVSYGKEISQAYDYVDRVEEIDGKLNFTAKKNDKWLVVVDLQEQEQKYNNLKDIKIFSDKQEAVVEDEKDSLTNEVKIDDKLARIEEKDGKTSVFLGDEKIGEDYDAVENLMTINNKLTFTAKRSDGWLVFFDKEKFDDKYDYIKELIEFNNELVFTAVRGKKQIVNQPSVGIRLYDEIGELKKIDNKLIFKIRKDNKWFVVVGNDEIGVGYDYIDMNSLKFVDNKILFRARQAGKWLVVYSDQEIGTDYDNIVLVDDINNNLILKLQKDNNWFIGVWGVIGNDLAIQHNEIIKMANSKNSEIKPIISFSEYGEGYDSIMGSVQVGGKLALWVSKNNKTFIIYDGQEFGGDYDRVTLHKVSEDKLVFDGVKNGKHYIVYDGEEVNSGFEGVLDIKEVDSKIAILGYKNEKKIVYYDSKEIGYNYFIVGLDLQVIDNKLSFDVATGDGLFPDKFFIYYDGKEIGKEYDDATGEQNVAGKLAYNAEKDKKKFVVYDGRELGKEFDEARLASSIDGDFKKLTFIAKKDDKFFVVYDEKPLSGRYDDGRSFHLVKEINGKLFFTAKNDKKYLAVYDDKELGVYDSYINDLIMVGNKPAFIAKKDGKQVVVYDDQVFGQDGGYGEVATMNSVADKLAFIINKNGKDVIIYEGKELVINDYEILVAQPTLEAVFSLQLSVDYLRKIVLMNLDNKLALYVVANKGKDNETINIYYDNKIFGSGFDLALFPQKINNDLVFVGAEENKTTNQDKVFLIYNNQKITPAYQGIIPIVEFGKYVSLGGSENSLLEKFNNKVIYQAIRDDKVFILMEDGEQAMVGKTGSGLEQKAEALLPEANVVDKPVVDKTITQQTKIESISKSATKEDLAKIPLADANLLLGVTDTDKDGLSDIIEEALGTDKNKADTDDDTYGDKTEVLGGYNPNGSGKLAIDLDFAITQKGKILIQSEPAEYAWYINYADGKKYFLGLKDQIAKSMESLDFIIP